MKENVTAPVAGTEPAEHVSQPKTKPRPACGVKFGATKNLAIDLGGKK